MHSKFRPRTLLASCGLLALFALPAAANSYLPLMAGNSWQLNYQNTTAASMTLKVLSAEEISSGIRRGRVEWKTPWGFSYIMVLRSTSAGIEHEGFEFSTGVTSFPNPLPLFMEGNVGQTWTSALGPVTLVSKTATVTAAAGTFTNVRHYRISYSDGSTQSWFLADKVGYVQFGESPMQFPLATRTVTLEPAPLTATQVPGACGVVGIEPNPLSGQSVAALMASLTASGSRFYEFAVTWSQIEPSPGTYDFSLIRDALQLANQNGMTVGLTIKTVDTNFRRLPAEVSNLAWDNALMLSRWQNLLTALGPNLGSSVKWVQLANEVDLYFINRPTEVAAFTKFFNAGQQALAKSAPAASVGLVFNYDALRLSNATFTQLKNLGAHYAFTFYNLDGTTTRAAENVSIEIPLMLSMTGSKPVILTEVGFPSATLAGSSEDKQRAFYTLLLEQIRKNSGKILAARFFLMTDLPASVTNSIASAYGYATNSPFAAYLGSLGLRSEAGVNKLALTYLMSEMPKFIQSNYCYKIVYQ